MLHRAVLFGILSACIAISGPKRLPGPATSGNDVVDIYATVHMDPEDVTKLLGMNPGFPLIVVEVRVAPKGDTRLNVDRDDFTLLSGKDGQRSEPLEPGQIAGKGSMVVSSVGVRGTGGGFGNTGGPIWGGVPGVGPVPSARPMGSAGAGNSATVTEANSKIENGTGDKENPLLKVLKEKILQRKEMTNDADSGLLYFMLDGKPPKPKDLSLIYKSTAGRVIVDFK